MTDSTRRHAANIAAAADFLRSGKLVAFPTETVYGLGADACSDEAVERIYRVKGRPAHNPLIVHTVDWRAAQTIVEPTPIAERLAERFWPGPLTLVLPAKADAVSPRASAGLPTIAVRAPNHPIAQALIREFGGPVVAPSANRSGRLSPTTAAAVREEFGEDVAAILDGGPCRVGVESTIVKISDNDVRLLRPGGVSLEELEQTIGAPLLGADGQAVQAPGMLESHYAPRALLRLNAASAAPGEAWLGFGPDDANASLAENLSPTGDLDEAGRRLFSALRALDAAGAQTIAVAPIPLRGVGLAINDRLKRAAAPRP